MVKKNGSTDEPLQPYKDVCVCVFVCARERKRRKTREISKNSEDCGVGSAECEEAGRDLQQRQGHTRGVSHTQLVSY